MLAIVIKNGKAVVVPDSEATQAVLSSEAYRGENAALLPNNIYGLTIFVILILITLFISFLILKLTVKQVMPKTSRYLGYLVGQFKKGMKENE